MKKRGSLLVPAACAAIVLALFGFSQWALNQKSADASRRAQTDQPVSAEEASLATAITDEHQSVAESEGAEARPAWMDYYPQLATALKLLDRPAKDLSALGEPVPEKYLPLGMKLADGYLSYRWVFEETIGGQYSGLSKKVEVRAAVDRDTKKVAAIAVDLECDSLSNDERFTRPTVTEVLRLIGMTSEPDRSFVRYRTYGKFGGMVAVTLLPGDLYVQADYLDGSPVRRASKTDFANGNTVERVIWRPDFSLGRTRVKRVYYCHRTTTGKDVFLNDELYGFSAVSR